MERHKTKNVMRTPEEKEKLILEYRDSGIGVNRFACLHDTSRHTFWEWIKKYRELGIDGLNTRYLKICKIMA